MRAPTQVKTYGDNHLLHCITFEPLEEHGRASWGLSITNVIDMLFRACPPCARQENEWREKKQTNKKNASLVG